MFAVAIERLMMAVETRRVSLSAFRRSIANSLKQ